MKAISHKMLLVTRIWSN